MTPPQVRTLAYLLPIDLLEAERLLEDVESAMEEIDEGNSGTGALVTVNNVGKAVTRKPTNLFLSWRKLAETVPDVILASAGSAAVRWLIPLAALYVWNKLYNGAEEPLTDAEATVMQALWANADSTRKMNEMKGLEVTNRMRSQHSLPALNNSSYNAAINRLTSMGCVYIDRGQICLRERVKIN